MASRAYESPRRTSAAAETRLAILTAALSLFKTSGYAATTIAAVAARADVSVNTVYSSVGGKPLLLVELIREAAADVRIEEAMVAVRSATTGREVLHALAEGTLDSFRSHSWLLGALYDNTGSDPVLAEAAAAAERGYSKRLAEGAARIAELGELRAEVPLDEAADALWFYFGLRAWKDLRARGWGWNRTMEWVVAQCARAVLAE